MRKTQADMQKLYFTFLGLSWIIKCVRDWSHATGGHWTERSEGSGWSDSGMAESPTARVFLVLRSKMLTTWGAKENSWSERSERRTPKLFL